MRRHNADFNNLRPVVSTVMIFVGYQKNWHRRIFSRHQRIQTSQISHPIFHVPQYSIPGRQGPPPNTNINASDPEASRMSEEETSCRSITTPPPVYTTLPTFPSPVEAYYQPVEIYRAVMGSPSVQQQDQPAMPLSSLPLSIPLPPAFPPPSPPQRHALPSPTTTSPPPPSFSPLPATATPDAPSLPSSSPSSSYYITCDGCSPRAAGPYSQSQEETQSSFQQPQPSPPPKSPPQTPSPSIIIQHPTPSSHIAPFLDFDPTPSAYPHPHPYPNALRSNSHDTNASTIIDPDTMSERSNSMSPTTVPGAAIRVQHSNSNSNSGRGTAPPAPSASTTSTALLGLGVLGLGLQSSRRESASRGDDGDGRGEGGMPAAVVGLGISMPPSSLGVVGSGRCALA